MRYVIRNKETGHYIGCKLNEKDVDCARLYKRRCDCKNSVRVRHGVWEDFYEIIPCIVRPAKSYQYRVEPTLSMFYIGRDGSHFKSQTFATKEAAEAYLDLEMHNCNVHKDYFRIVEIEVPDEVKVNAPAVNIRPNWQDYFLGLALIISRRSRDQHTQHGCVLVDSKTNRVIGTGYNSFPQGMDDSSLPLNRPDPAHPELDDKYPWMIHSEVNACAKMVQPADENTIAYITGEPCTACLMVLWQNGVTKVIHNDAYGSKYLIDEKTRKRRKILLFQTGMTVTPVKADLSWLKAACLSI